jgi:hypothetical protein
VTAEPTFTQTVTPPSKALLDACEALEDVVVTFLQARKRVTGIGEYESTTHAIALTNLAIRFIEGTIELARRDVALLPSGMVTARAAYEAGIRIAWLLAPDDLFASESRWVSLIGEELDHTRRVAAFFGAGSSTVKRAQQRHAELAGFRDHVITQLRERGYVVDKRAPNLRKMLADLGEDRKYLMYVEASQVGHAAWAGAELYRRNLGAEIEFGEFAGEDGWRAALSMCWWVLHTPFAVALRRWGIPLVYPDLAIAARAQKALDKVAGRPQSGER